MSGQGCRTWAVGVAFAIGACGGCMPDPPDTEPDGAPWPAPACVSGTYWALGDQGDNDMHPGEACITCHSGLHEGPTFRVAGTIYSALNEADNCNGFPGTYSPVQNHGQVEVVDATGTTFIIVANDVGNFYTTYNLQYPLQHVQVRSPNGHLSQMLEAAPDGDCNACHTRIGTTTIPGHASAPGRIVIAM